ncbi:MAG: CsbD family protein [Acidobacteria bacterium]|nr:CsbD family protein [Acidobacteriota bacterium]
MSTASSVTEKIYESAIVEEAAALGERAKGALKEKLGSLTGNEALKREGQKENLEGRLRQENNDVLPKDHSGSAT